MELSKTLVDKLKPGDILQYHIPNEGLWNLFYWTHTVMYIGDNKVVGAGGPSAPEDIYYFFGKQQVMDNYTALRLKGITEEQRQKVVQFAIEAAAKPYDFWSIVRITKQLNPPANHPGYGYYCTEMVWANYFINCGVDLDMNHFGQINPMEIYMNRKLELLYVHNRWKVWLPYLRLY